METTATFARPCSTARNLVLPEGAGRAVVVEAVGLAFSIRAGAAGALRAHDLDVTATLLVP